MDKYKSIKGVAFMQKRRKKKLRYSRILIVALLLILIITGIIKIGEKAHKFMHNQNYDNAINSDTQNTNTQMSQNPSTNKLYSPYAILIRLSDDKILFESKSEVKIYPASLTKIMTAMISIENISDLQHPIVLPESIFPDLYTANASMAGFLPGEEVSAIDLLYGILLPSGAEASKGLAIDVSGSETKFVKLMNEKAVKLGMKNTHFTNVCGLHDDNHHSTAKDISILLKYALKSETFREIFTTAKHSTASTNLHPDGITMHSTMFDDIDAYGFDAGEIIGGKTGYTEEAGLCLASLAKENGEEYILVTAGAAGNHQTEQYNIMDALTVYSKCIKQ